MSDQEIKSVEEFQEALLESKDQTSVTGGELNEKQKDMLKTFFKNSRQDYLKEGVQLGHVDQSALQESTTDGTNTTTTSDITRYDQIFMPLIRRTMPALLAMDLVGVQPLPGPRGIVRTIRKQYGRDVEEGGSTNLVVEEGDEASGQNVFDKYSQIALGDTKYDASDNRNPFDQTVALEGDRGNPMKLEVVTQTVETKTRKLAARWSLESDDDLNSLDGLDMESELMTTVSDEIRREMDRELLDDLTGLAGVTEALDFANVDGRYAGEKLSSMTIKLSELSTSIATRTRLGGATWMVVSPRVLTGLKNASNSTFVPVDRNAYRPSETMMVGTFDGNINVYVDIYADNDYALLGLKNDEIRTGYIYSPYIPLSASGVVVNPETMDKGLAIRTRYGLTSFTDPSTSLGDSPDFYSRATIGNLELGFTNV